MRSAALAALAVFALSVAACHRQLSAQQRVMPLFGTIVQVDIVDADRAAAETAFDAIQSLYQRLDLDWRSFGPGELGRANALLGAGQAARLSPELRHIVQRSLEIRDRSGGLFDPRIGPLIELWGFQDMANRVPTGPPDEAAIVSTRAGAIDAAQLHLEGNRLRADAPVRLELAGVAKGSALVAGGRELGYHGVRNALITIGGDVLALGSRGVRPWRVGVRDPLRPGILGTVDLSDGEAALSSGIYERRFESGGRTFHHILDPRTGRPARGTAGTTVVGRDAELANAAAATLLIGGEKEFFDLARSLGVDCALLVTEDGKLLMTAGMRSRLNAR